MQFITSLFGGSGNTLLTAGFALGIVLVLIVLGVWLLKLIFAASSNVGRGRNRRLSVVDSLALDPKRQLLIIRRDNVEHLILTGGPHDLVVETGIAVAETAAAHPPRRAAPMPAQRRPVHSSAAIAPPVTPEPAAAAKSLRHTGLLRTAEADKSDNPNHVRPDSAKENLAQTQGESAEFGDDSFKSTRDEHSARRG